MADDRYIDWLKNIRIYYLPHSCILEGGCDMIQYIKGDATQPQGEGMKVICHITNDIGAWGAGFVLAISRRWRKPESIYRREYPRELGQVQFIRVEDDITVANMCAQRGIRSCGGIPPFRSVALVMCLDKVVEYCLLHKASMHGPRFGAGLSGGSWPDIEKLIEEHVCSKGIAVTIYDWRG